MKIQDAAEATGLTADTIRFYERKGVLPRPPRQANGYREYTEQHLLTLRMARGLRELDVPLDDVASIVSVAHAGTCNEVQGQMTDRFRAALTDIDEQLRRLRDLRRRLAGILAALESAPPGDAKVRCADSCDCVTFVHVQ